MLLSTQQVAEQLGISRDTVARMCKESKLPAINAKKDGGTRDIWRIDSKALAAWKKENAENLPKGRPRIVLKVTPRESNPDSIVGMLKQILHRLDEIEALWR